MNEYTWEVVSIASGMINANIIVGRLETEGIPTKLKYEAVGPIYSITIDGLGEVKVMVPSEYADLARAALSRTYEEDDLDWDR